MISIFISFLTNCRSRCHGRKPKRVNGRERMSGVDTSPNPNTNSRTMPVGAVQNCRTCARHAAMINLDPVELLARRTPPPPYVSFIANYDLNLALQQQQRATGQNGPTDRFPPHPHSVSHQQSLVPCGHRPNGPNAHSYSPPPTYDQVVQREDGPTLVSPPPIYHPLNQERTRDGTAPQ